MSEDIIRIDGVEYEAIEHDSEPSDLMVHLRPKRRQTGWVCRGCFVAGPCYKMGEGAHKPPRCLASGVCITTFNWQPFYGKVVE